MATAKAILEGMEWNVFPSEAHGKLTYYMDGLSPGMDKCSTQAIAACPFKKGDMWPESFQGGPTPEWLRNSDSDEIAYVVGNNWTFYPRCVSHRVRNGTMHNSTKMFVDLEFRSLPAPKDEFGNGSQQKQTDLYLTGILGNTTLDQIKLDYTTKKGAYKAVPPFPAEDVPYVTTPATTSKFFPANSRITTGYFWSDKVTKLDVRLLQDRWALKINGTNFISDPQFKQIGSSVGGDVAHWLCNSVNLQTIDSWMCAISAEFIYNVDSWDQVVVLNDPFTGKPYPITAANIAQVRAPLVAKGSIIPPPIKPFEAGIGKFPLYKRDNLNSLIAELLNEGA